MDKKIFRLGVLLPAAIAGFVVVSILAFQVVRLLLVEDSEAMVHAVAQRMLPALLVNDSQQVNTIMKALESYPGVQNAELVSAQGAAIASYVRGGEQLDTISPVFSLASSLDDPNQLHVMAPITFDSLIVANLHIVVDLWPIYFRIMAWLGVLLIIPSALYVGLKQLRIRIRFEKIANIDDTGTGGGDQTFDLHTATSQVMAEADISLEYQPIRRLSDAGLFGMEIMACWRHPSGQTLYFSPANFSSLAESIGICLPFDNWLLRTAFEQAAMWQRQYGPLVLTLDVSETQFRDPLFPQLIRDLCEAAQYPHQLLELEVRESMLTRHPLDALKCIQAFDSKGLSLTVEGFGLMQNSIQLLQSLPIHKVKLDGKLIKNLLNDKQVFLFIQETISNALVRDVQVMSDGVESSQQCAEIKKMGCILGQGIYFNHPLSAKCFESLLVGQSSEYLGPRFRVGTSDLIGNTMSKLTVS